MIMYRLSWRYCVVERAGIHAHSLYLFLVMFMFTFMFDKMLSLSLSFIPVVAILMTLVYRYAFYMNVYMLCPSSISLQHPSTRLLLYPDMIFSRARNIPVLRISTQGSPLTMVHRLNLSAYCT